MHWGHTFVFGENGLRKKKTFKNFKKPKNLFFKNLFFPALGVDGFGRDPASAQQQCCASLCHGVRRLGRSADCQVKRLRTHFRL